MLIDHAFIGQYLTEYTSIWFRGFKFQSVIFRYFFYPESYLPLINSLTFLIVFILLDYFCAQILLLLPIFHSSHSYFSFDLIKCLQILFFNFILKKKKSEMPSFNNVTLSSHTFM